MAIFILALGLRLLFVPLVTRARTLNFSCLLVLCYMAIHSFNFWISWMASSVPGLSSKMSLFLLKMLHDILPTRERMNRMNLPGVPSAVCTLCDGNAADTSEHALLTCSYIRVRSENLLLALQQEDPTMTLERNKFLDFRSEDLYPMTFLTASILEQLWLSRLEKKRWTWPSVVAQVESQVLLLREGRFADKVNLMLEATSPIVVDT